MVVVSAWGISMPNPAAKGLIKKFTRKPNTQTHPVAGLHPATNMLLWAASALFKSIWALLIS
jgi:hypothetical protein